MNWSFLLILLFFTLPLHAFNDEEAARGLELDVGITGAPWTFIGTNSVYVSADFSRQLMVVRNVPGKLKGPQFFDADGYLIVNLPESTETITSIAVVGITKEQLLPYLDTVSFSWKNFLRFIPSAHANECMTSGMPSVPGLSDLTTFFTSGPGAGFARCLMNFAQGAWSATGGAVAGFLEGVGNLVSDPRAWWNRRVQQMNRMWQFVTHFNREMRNLYNQVTNLPAETITQMMCAFLGGVGAGVAVAILTGGAGLGPLLARVTQYVQKISGLARVFQLFSTLGKIASIPSRFFEGIASGRIGEAVIDRIDAFARNRMDVMAEGAIQCAL